jgi:hypothetical protein
MQTFTQREKGLFRTVLDYTVISVAKQIEGGFASISAFSALRPSMANMRC